jgi:hypothetical protein
MQSVFDQVIDRPSISVGRTRSDRMGRTNDPDEARLLKIAQTIGKILQRPLRIDYAGPSSAGNIGIYQRCIVCRADIFSRVMEGETEIATITGVGVSARVSYLKHVCPPIETSLHSFTWTELEQLRGEMERDSIRLAERVAAIEAMEKSR